jgi:superoxide dismutase, Cu-Zn family
MRINSLLIGLSIFTALGCSDDNPSDSPAKTASATLTATTGNTAAGSVTFTNNGAQTQLTASISGAPPSAMLGFHIHMNAACGADGMEAGGHWNPEMVDHGQWESSPHHLGDLGNLETDASGAASFQLATDAWSIGSGASDDIVNHAVVVHAMADDFTTQPTGNAGGRIACGVIQLK